MDRTLLLVGGGHSHVQVLESLHAQALSGMRVTVVVDRPIAIYSGMVPGFVAGQYRAEELEIDIPALCRWAGVECRVDPVVRIDAAARQLHLESGTCMTYDFASLNIGSTVTGLEMSGVRDHAIPTRPISGLVERIDRVVTAARQLASGRAFQTLVVGGGAGGIELAFTLRERLVQAAAGPIEVRLIHSGRRILEGYPQGLARRAERDAAARGIELVSDCRVQAVENDLVSTADERSWPYDALLWVTGAAGHRLVHDSGLPTDARGFVKTRSTLQVEGFDELLAVGDCATLEAYPDTPKAGVYAVRQGPVLTRNLRALTTGAELESYRPQSDFLTLLNLGDGTALGTKKGISFEGRWVMRWKDWIDRRFMARFQLAPKSTNDAVA